MSRQSSDEAGVVQIYDGKRRLVDEPDRYTVGSVTLVITMGPWYSRQGSERVVDIVE